MAEDDTQPSPSRELAASPLAGLQERDHALARAAEDVFAGRSVRAAAATWGIPSTTLHDAVKRDPRYIGPAERQALIAEAKAEAIEIRRQAARVTLEALNDGSISTAQAPIVYGIATDKLVKLDQIDRPTPPDTVSALLDRIPDGGSVTVSVSPTRPPIDVTPHHDDE